MKVTNEMLYEAVKYQVETFYPETTMSMEEIMELVNSGTKESESFKQACIEDYCIDVLGMKEIK